VTRITILFAALTALLWFADWVDTPDSIPAIKPLFWAAAVCLAALLIRALVDALRGARGDGRASRD
jgi:hypothetical protein